MLGSGAVQTIKVARRNTLHAVCDADGKPLVLLLSKGQMSDHKGARLILDALPPASTLIADRGYDQQLVPGRPQRAGL